MRHIDVKEMLQVLMTVSGKSRIFHQAAELQNAMLSITVPQKLEKLECLGELTTLRQCVKHLG